MNLETGVRFYPCFRKSAEKDPCPLGEIVVYRTNGGLNIDDTGNFYTWEVAEGLYPGIRKSGSSSVCPACYRRRFGQSYPDKRLMRL